MRAIALLIAALPACAGSADDTAAPWGPVEVETEAGTFAMTLTLAPDPPVAGETTLGIALSDDGGAVEDATLTVTPWMPMHGHGVSEDPVVRGAGGGDYTADFAWSMPGEWEVTIDVDAAGVEDSVVVPVEVE